MMISFFNVYFCLFEFVCICFFLEYWFCKSIVFICIVYMYVRVDFFKVERDVILLVNV